MENEYTGQCTGCGFLSKRTSSGDGVAQYITKPPTMNGQLAASTCVAQINLRDQYGHCHFASDMK